MATSVMWRGLTLGADPAAGQTIVSVEGWEELPPARYDNVPRARGHGSHPSPVWSDQRTVTVTGTAFSTTQRNALLLNLQQSMTFGDADSPGEDLTITLAGRTLTATAQLLRCAPAIAAGTWNHGLIGWVAQWRCPDPLRYGALQTVSTGLPTPGSGGVTYPLTYPLSYGTPGASGQLTLANGGTADAPVLFIATGSLPSGFSIAEIGTGRQLNYPAAVPAGAHLYLNTADGSVLLEGTANRRGSLLRADWLQVPRRSSLSVQFVSLGGTYDANAGLTAQWRPTSW